MKASSRTFRMLALFLGAMLALMTLLSLFSQTPLIDIGSLQGMDDGQRVIVQGLLVDLWVNDGGYESAVLVDDESDATVRVWVSQSLTPPPSSYAHIGDRLRAVGDLSLSHGSATLYSDSDSVVLLAKSAQTMTLSMLSYHWELFLGDEFAISGVLLQPLAGADARLFDCDFTRSITLQSDVRWDVSSWGGS